MLVVVSIVVSIGMDWDILAEIRIVPIHSDDKVVLNDVIIKLISYSFFTYISFELLSLYFSRIYVYRALRLVWLVSDIRVWNFFHNTNFDLNIEFFFLGVYFFLFRPSILFTRHLIFRCWFLSEHCSPNCGLLFKRRSTYIILFEETQKNSSVI